ncbi:endonuclease domain-containing protein [Shinella zoogloeoides]|uniref:endonuclease domain-containing protein n=1 Tax=Shinella zoogloeoides TaxID=352475 RepID=UPI00273EABCC|nr:endonuclease domain-containing protein [Shinella zoogloeoides]WLR91587.1 endonuclease domain-containing protein [Shinella zoogloeoides]
MLLAVNTPSSDPSGHLLPVGEKGKCVATSLLNPAPHTPSWREKKNGSADIPFSPTGRRWPEGSDEGGMPNATDITKRRPGKTRQARRLRQIDTEEERRLWSNLRDRRLNGFKFSRQIPLGVYFVDFLCRDLRLVVEIDGFQHAEMPSDALRTDWLNRNGYSILRFWNHEITQERRAVLDTILAALTGQMTERCRNAKFYPAIPAETRKTGEPS